MSTTLRVPYGRTADGVLVPAREASRESPYTCPGCGAPLVLKAGEVIRPHFSHPAHGACTSETILHRTAKDLVAQSIEANARGERAITLRSTCRWCLEERTTEIRPGTFSGAWVERSVGPYVCDVVASRGGHDRLAVEVVVTHRVEDAKAVELALPWVELDAEAILAAPTSWEATDARLGPCNACKGSVDRVVDVASRWGIDRSLYHPLTPGGGSAYVAAVTTCYQCREYVPVFCWGGDLFAEATPPAPRPHTVLQRRSPVQGSRFWTNTCPSCRTTLGDNYLYDGGGALAHLHFGGPALPQYKASPHSLPVDPTYLEIRRTIRALYGR